jgi:hypothetical protein
MALEQRFTVIRRKLNLLSKQDEAWRLFGANHHRYELAPCLAEPQLDEFERRYAIRLPHKYRAFLHEIGNGGPGPFYGLLSLEAALPDSALERDPMLLAKPFPLVSALDFVEVFKHSTGLDPFDDHEEYVRRLDEDERFRQQHDQLWQQFEEPAYSQGALAICDYGCGLYFSLIVSGPERGKVWFDRRADEAGLFPLRHPHHRQEHLDFLTWYERWLDWALGASADPARMDDEDRDPYADLICYSA